MLCDQHMDELVDAFEAGFAATASMVCPFERDDRIRRAAWADGTQYRTVAFAQHLYCRESIAPPAPYAAFVSHFRNDHPFVRTAVSFNGACK